MDQLLSHWLNIRPDERRRTALLFLFLFACTSFIIIGRTARDALLLSHNGLDMLPRMYVGVAVASALAVLLYNQVIARFSPYHVLRGTLVLTLLSLGGMRVGMSLQLPYIEGAFYIFMEVAGSILTVQFWTFANEAFSTREAKRLFGVVGSGGVMAGTICGFGGAWLAPVAGLENLLFVCMLSLLACDLLARSVRHLPAQSAPSSRPVQAGAEEDPVGTPYIVALGLLVVLLSIAVNIIDFQFKVIAREHFVGPTLATFLGSLYGACGLLSFFAHLFFTGRVLTQRGILPALLALPTTLLLGMALLLASPGLLGAAVVKTSDLAMRYSIHDTCQQLLYLPLPVRQRRRVKAQLEGLIKPLAIGLTGAGLTLTGTSALGLWQSGWIALLCIVAWIGISVWLKQGYVAALLHSLERRGGLDDEIPVSLSDVASTQALVEALRAGDVRMVLGALELLPARRGLDWSPHVLPLLLAPSREVRIASFEYCRREDIAIPTATREQWLIDLDDELRSIGVSMLEGRDGTEHFLQDPSPDVQARAIVGLLRARRESHSREALDALELLRQSPRPEARRAAAWAMGELKAPEEGLRKLLQDPVEAVQREAIIASGKAQLLALVPMLQDLLRHSSLGDEAAAALGMYGEVVLGAMLERLPQVGDDETARNNLFLALRGMGTRRVAEELLRRIPADRLLRHELLNVTYHLLRGRAEGALRLDQIRAPLLMEIQDCYQWWAIGATLGGEPAWELMRSAVAEERALARARALLLLAHVYPVRPFRTLEQALTTSHTTALSNAIEVVDEIIDPELRAMLMPLLEPLSNEARVAAGKQLFALVNLSSSEWCRYFLTQPDKWLIICALAATGPLHMVGLMNELRSLLEDSNPQIQEAAWRALGPMLPLHGQRELWERAVLSSNPNLRLLGEHWLRGQEEHMISSVDKVLFLKRVDLFTQLPGRELLNLANIAEQVTFAEQTVIFEEGAEADSLYLVLSGQVKVSRGGREIARLGQRECFGEMALLDHSPRSATVTALDRVSALRIERDSFAELLAQKREIALGIIRILVARLREANER